MPIKTNDPFGIFPEDVKRKPVRTSDRKHLLEFQKGKCGKCKKSFKVMKVRPHLHHKNGNPKDNRIVNMVLLCPNCHDKIHQKDKKKRTKKKPKKPWEIGTIKQPKLPKFKF